MSALFPWISAAQSPREAARASLPGYDVRAAGATSDSLSFERAPGTRFLLPVRSKDRARAAAAPDPVEEARRFLSSYGESRLLRRVDLDGTTWLDFQQQLHGTPVFEAIVKVAVAPDGHVSVATLPAPLPRSLEPLAARLSAEDAVRVAFRAAGATAPTEFQPDEGKSRILADAIAFPLSRETARLAWRILLELDGRNSYELLIDAGDGSLLLRHNLHRQAGTGRIWKSAPDKGEREAVPFPESWLAAGSTTTTGNHADAYLDTDGDDRPDSLPDAGIRNGRAYSETLIFDFPAPSITLQQDPRTYRAAAVTNAFYFANLAHDYFYGLGFNEQAGNFQRDNGGRGGKGGDPVLVEVQDPYYNNNASMSLTLDGISPRMQLGIFTRGTATRLDDRDLAYDGQTILHEYAHGVTNRLVGGGSSLSCLAGTQSSALDEGWGDYFASSFFNDPLQSAWVSPNERRGIRRQSYENYTLTYEDFANEGAEPHRDGELWAAALWDLRKALGQQAADKLVLRALLLTPCRPSFIDARDAIVAADQALNGGSNQARIFQVFARHGMGGSASGAEDSPEAMTVFNAAFDLPADLQTGSAIRGPSIASRPGGYAVSGEAFVYQIQASAAAGGTLSFELSRGPRGMTVDARTGLVKWVAGFISERAKIVVTDGLGGRVIHGFYIRVVTPLTADRPITLSMPRGRAGTASILVPGGTPVLQVLLRGENGDGDLVLLDPDGFPDADTPRSGSFETISVATPAPGRWLVGISAFTALDDIQLTARMPAPTLISGNGRYDRLSGDKSSETFYRVAVPPGSNELLILTEGGTGDVDVVVRRGRVPVCQVFDDYISYRCFYDAPYASFRYGNKEGVGVVGPQAGDWYINLTSATGYTAVMMTTKLDVRPSLAASASTLTFNVMEGAAAPPAQSLRISDPSGGSFTWSGAVSPAASWLRLDKSTGSGDSTVAVSVNPQGLVPGTYTSSIIVSSTPALSGSPHTIKVSLTVEKRPVLALGATELNFTSAPGVSPPVQRLQISNSGGGSLEWSLAAATMTGGAWLAVDQPRGIGNANLQVIVQAGGLSPGVYEGTLTISAAGAATVVVRVRYTVVILFQIAGDGPPVSPGEMLAIQGNNLTAECSPETGAPNPCPRAEGYPLPVELGGTRVTVNGVAAPLLAVTPGEIQFIVPFEVEGAEAKIVAVRQGVASAPAIRGVAAQSLGVFTLLENGAGAARLYHGDGAPVSRSSPLQAQETVSLLAGGLGAVSPAVISGTAAPASPLAEAVHPVKVFFDGQECTPLAAYLEPGLAGYYRIQVVAPAGLSRKFPALVLQGAVSVSNETSAGGPSLLDVTPNVVPRGGDMSVTVRGINLPEGAVLKIGGEVLSGELTDGPLQSLKVTIAARLLESGSERQLVVVDPAAPDEAPSNAVVLRLR
ncbi:MAG: M36 family metallopeptidase [Acidobacteria bacterium]|nr:M36 family metallopeptidase [Acidobacteriota bacterium]